MPELNEKISALHLMVEKLEKNDSFILPLGSETGAILIQQYLLDRTGMVVLFEEFAKIPIVIDDVNEWIFLYEFYKI